MKTITSSEARCRRRCPRLHHLQYQQLYRPAKVSAALASGTVWHLWREGKPGQVDDPYENAKLEAMNALYPSRDYEVLGVEVSFRIPLLNPATMRASRTWEIAGVIDKIVRIGGLVFVLDHKTSGENITPGSRFWQRLALDTQMSVYVMAAEAMGYDIAGFYYDVVGKPGIKPHKATPEEKRKTKKDGSYYASVRLEDETPQEYGQRCLEAIQAEPERYYQLQDYARTEGQLRDCMADLWAQALEIHSSSRAGLHPRNPEACMQYGECPFWAHCAYGEELEGNERFVKIACAHPEVEERRVL